jgi:hypothetical protein
MSVRGAYGRSIRPTPRRAGSHNGANVLWRYIDWRCEYAANTCRYSGGTVSLYFGAALIMRKDTHRLAEMLSVASSWREALAAPACGQSDHDARSH